MASEFARHLRENMTDEGRVAWAKLRHRQMAGFRFRRQAPIGQYVVDFVCFECKLVIELDGGQHAERIEHDNQRTRWLETQGFRVIRFWNFETQEDWDDVSERIWKSLNELAETHRDS